MALFQYCSSNIEDKSHQYIVNYGNNNDQWYIFSIPKDLMYPKTKHDVNYYSLLVLVDAPNKLPQKG